MAIAKLSKKYQIVVPKEIRRAMKLGAGTAVTLYSLDERRAMLVKHPKDYVQALKGLGKEVWKGLGGADQYLKRERASWDR